MSEEGREKPVWLDKWPTELEMAQLYSPNLRSAAIGFFTHAKDASIEWTPFSLRGVFDGQHCSFRLSENGWIPRCTCGYVKPHCIHTYMLHLMLKRVCREEGWSLPGQEKPGVFMEKAETPPRREYDVIEQKAPKKKVVDTSKKLEVEADFKYNPCNVVIRFYVKSNGLRELTDLCWIRDYAVELSRGVNPQNWSEGDQAFLQWVLPILRKCTLQELMGKNLVLTKEAFHKWTDKWGDVQGRIFDRDTQQAINEKMFLTPVRMQIELYRSKRGIVGTCAFYLEDGRKFFLHDLVPMILDDPTGYYIATKLKGFKPPISWDALTENFGRGRLDLTEADVLKRLPHIIEHHLETIAEGPYVSVTHIDASSVMVFASIDDRGHFAVSLRGKSSGHVLQNGIYSRGSGFEVVLVENRSLEKTQALLKKHGAKQDSNDSNRFLWQANAENAAALAEFWDALPPNIERRYSSEVKGLLSGETNALELIVSLQEKGRLVQADARCQCKGFDIAPDDLAEAFSAQRSVVRAKDGRWFRLAPSALADFIAQLRTDGLESGHLLMLPTKAADFAAKRNKFMKLENTSLPLIEKLAQRKSLDIPKPPAELEDVLRSYQKEAVAFLAERSRCGVGSILADDMGLGKTLETLALLECWRLALKGQGGELRALVVAPASVLDVWRREVARYCPNMPCTIIHGAKAERDRLIEKNASGLLVTSYSLVRNDVKILSEQKFDFLVLDEAQNIKNPEAQVTNCVNALNAECRIALTGTPLENALSDVCSILEFVNPKSLGPIHNYNGFPMISEEMVRRWLKLVMLRRTKEMVDVELPSRTEETITLEMPLEVRQAYNAELEMSRNRANGGGMAQVLAEITRMRRFCCSPELVRTPETQYAAVQSVKMDFLLERCQELIASGHSVLVFSQFTSLLEQIRRRLSEAAVAHFVLTGDTPVDKRGEIAQQFNDSESASVFLLSLKAAGTGLTLTRADYVFLFDPWWNPSVENQAIDRTHRLGQSKPVFAYKLVLAGSIEENVMRITEEKRQLFADVIDGAAGDTSAAPFSEAELRALLE